MPKPKSKVPKRCLIIGLFLAFMLSFSMVNADVLTWTSPSYTNFTFGKEYRGIMIGMNTTRMLTNISRQADSPAFRNCYLYDSGENLLNTSAFDEFNCTLNYQLDADSSYYILTDGEDAGEVNDNHQYLSASLPYESEYFSVVAGSIRTGGVFSNQTGPDQTFDISEIYTEEIAELIPTFTEFWLNDTQYTDSENPYTLCNDSFVNLTGYTNVTIINEEFEEYGLIILANDTMICSIIYESEYWYNNLSSDCFYSQLLENGFYNITIVNNGNETYSPSSQTQWVNLTYCPEGPAANFTAGYVICIDNSTLFHNNSFVYEIGDERTWYENCPYGCSNETFSCKLEPMTQGFYAFGFVIAFILIIVFFDKVVLKR